MKILDDENKVLKNVVQEKQKVTEALTKQTAELSNYTHLIIVSHTSLCVSIYYQYVHVHMYAILFSVYTYSLEQCQISLTAYTEENKKLLDINQKLRKQTSTVKLQHDQ